MPPTDMTEAGLEALIVESLIGQKRPNGMHKFQTGYDEPLLHTMYVDKILSGGKAVQTLSRLNRAHPRKHDTFILDFENDADMIQKSFAPYYRTTILSEATDPDKLHDLKAILDAYQVYCETEVETFMGHYLQGAGRDQLDPILDGSGGYSLLADNNKELKTLCRRLWFDFFKKPLDCLSNDWEKVLVKLSSLIFVCSTK